MTIASTQNNFREHLKEYLDYVNYDNETVLVTRKNNQTAAVISQEKLNLLERALRAKEDSLEYAVVRDKLIDSKFLPDDDVVESNDEYWEQF